MKKVLIFLVALLLIAGAAYADNVSNTDHNLTDNTNPYSTTDTDEICVFCHTPHEASTMAPLWNRNSPVTTGYSMYTSTTINMTIQSAPESVSLACLSCHDGTVALDSLINEPGAGLDNPAIDWSNWANNNTMNILDSPAAFMSKDLSNDHPISIAYDTTADTDFNAIVSNAVGGVPLYDGTDANQVECGSCHNPHEDILPTFLRISNAGSALCLKCHIK